ncbi:MAG: TonB-dependent receptor [Gammaproteobacteria bacterium]|nr:TonB-dependent receptor [Gammaproteobacteria bacterium]
MHKPNNKAVRKTSIAAAIMMSSCLPYTAQAQLEEIIVTANKRSESANEIGMSIAAISGEKLAEQKLVTLEDISATVPGLSFATSQQNTPILTLRGIGFNESSLGVYPAVSLYVDEIPLPFPAMAAHSAYDLERVEVLKGPQGVLFGQNSTGGAINFIAAKPTEEVSYGGDISFGRFNKLETNAFVSGPLTERVGARLAIQNVQADDWQYSQTRRGDENGEEDYTAARLLLNFQPSDRSDVTVNLNAWRDKSDPQAFQFVAASPKRFDLALDKALEVVAVPFTKEDARAADWSEGYAPKGDKEFYQASVRGDFEISAAKNLTAIIAHSNYEQDQVHDGDGMSLIAADFEYNIGELESTFAEIRVAHDDSGALRWVVGANYEDSSTFEDQLLRYVGNTSHRASALWINGSGSTMEQEIESFAVFGNVDYDLTKDTTLKVGARYTDTTINAVSCGYAPPNLAGVPDASGGSGSNVARLFNILGARSSRPFDPLGIGDCFTLDATAGASGTVTEAAGIPGQPFVDELAEDNISWRIGVDHVLNEDVLLYANLSQGFKAGSYPTLSAATINEIAPVTEESVLSYEVGFKATMADARVQLNGAVFYLDYEDKQVRGKIPDPIFGPLDRLVNVPESTIAGAEVDIVAQLGMGFTLSAALTYLDSEVKEYIGFTALGANPSDPANNAIPEDLSGNSLPYTPELTYSLDLDYRTELASGGMLFAGFNVVGQSTTDAVFNGDDLAVPQDRIDAGTAKSLTTHYFEIESYATVGARIGYESADAKWKVMLWGKNITDEYYYNAVIASSENGARVAGRPQTYGITLGYKY